jgi:formylmethanofuran dehydrogenase subunit E
MINFWLLIIGIGTLANSAMIIRLLQALRHTQTLASDALYHSTKSVEHKQHIAQKPGYCSKCHNHVAKFDVLGDGSIVCANCLNGNL